MLCNFLKIHYLRLSLTYLNYLFIFQSISQGDNDELNYLPKKETASKPNTKYTSHIYLVDSSTINASNFVRHISFFSRKRVSQSLSLWYPKVTTQTPNKGAVFLSTRKIIYLQRQMSLCKQNASSSDQETDEFEVVSALIC